MQLMTLEKKVDVEREKRFSAIRRTKKILRYLPRRATLHRYPFIKYFASLARERPFLWSFHSGPLRRAFYVGSMISFSPLMGIQTPIAFCAALLFRCNLTVTVALQFITNPVTAGPIYYTAYKLGDWVTHFLGLELARGGLGEVASAVGGGAQVAQLALVFMQSYLETTIGGLIIGYLVGALLSLMHAFLTKRKEERKHYSYIHKKPNGS